jgi:hypothetical protein
MFDRGNLFLIQSTKHTPPATQALSGKYQLAALHEVHPSRYVHMDHLQAQWVNGENTSSEEWFVWRDIYFSHRQTTFTA